MNLAYYRLATCTPFFKNDNQCCSFGSLHATKNPSAAFLHGKVQEMDKDHHKFEQVHYGVVGATDDTPTVPPAPELDEDEDVMVDAKEEQDLYDSLDDLVKKMDDPELMLYYLPLKLITSQFCLSKVWCP